MDRGVGLAGFLGGLYGVGLRGNQETSERSRKTRRSRRTAGSKSRGRRELERMEDRTLLAGTITGVVFQDYNANGAYDTTTTIPNASTGTTPVAVDRLVAGVTVTAVDPAGVVRGTTTTTATGAYTLNATGTGPYKILFTNLPAGSTDGPRGVNSGTSVQVVPNGNSNNVSLGLSFPNDYSVNNPLLASNQYIYGDALNGSYANDPAIVGYTYSSGNQYGAAGDYGQPATFPFSVPANKVGTTFGLGYSPVTGSLYASSFTKRFAGYGPNAAGTGTTNGAIYSINPTTGAASVLADLNTIFGANTTGVNFRTLPSWNGYTQDGGNAGWDAVGKTALGGLDVSPDGSTIFVTNLADRSLYAIPTSGPINASTIRRVSIPFNAPGATGTAGGTQAGDLRPFAVTYHNGQLYVGMVNSAESTQNRADLRAYVYTVNPTTLAFSAAPVFQTALNYTRGNAAQYNGSGNPSAAWNPWSSTFQTLGAGNLAVYAQPMLSGIAFNSSGDMILGLRDRAGDQVGFLTNSNPANPSVQYNGVAAGDTLMAFINVDGNLSSGWTLENNARGPNGEGVGPQATNVGPGGGSFFYQQNFQTIHSNVAAGGVATIPGFVNVISSVFDPGDSIQSGGVRLFNTATGATTKAYQIYNIGNGGPPQSTFGKANGIGDVVALNSLAPIELGDRVFRDLDGDGIQDANEAGIAGVTVRIYQGTTLVGTAITNAQGNYLFNSANVSGGIRPNTTYQIRFDNGADFLAGGPLAGLLPTLVNADPSGLAGSKATVVGGVPVIDKTTGGAGVNDHTLDAGFIATGSVSGSAYVDANNDGIRQAGETPLAGITITLTGTNDLGNAVSVTTTTAADGSFTFAGLRPSNGAGYTITETLPAGYLAGRDTPGTLGGSSAPLSNAITGVVLTQGASGTGYTFGNLAPASLAGFSYVDANNDGIKGASELGIAGVTITLTGINDVGQAVNLTTTTLGDGSYRFNNLRPSNGAGYTITETQPAGFLDGRDTIGTPGGTAGNDTFTGVVLASGVNGVNNNFGELVTASLAGRVYFDANNNGVIDSGEVGIAGVTVTLTGTNDLGQAVNLTATTAADGSYIFNALRPSNGAGYTITETQPAGYLDGRDTIGTPGGATANDVFSGVVLNSGVNGVNNNFGELVPASLAGFVYVDTSNDGIKNTGEAGIAGVTVTLTGTNDLGAPVNLVAVTAADGSYVFNNLRPSNGAGYTITETQPAGFLDGRDTIGNQGGTVGNDSLTAITLISGAQGVANNFGELQAASLTGSVYVDGNNDGIRQGPEAGLAGVTVTLTGTNDLGVAINVVTTTAPDGTYLFSGLRPGSYTVTDTPPTTYTPGKIRVGTAGGTISGNNGVTQIALTSGAAATTYDFGQTGATVSGTVFVDVNANGTQDGGEAGLGGQTITLLNSANQVVGTATTRADGTYSFPNLPAGNYTVVETQPSGYGTSTPTSVPVTVTTAGLPGVSFGATTAQLTGQVFTDTNTNGTFEPGVDLVGAGTQVTLTGTDVNGNPVSRITMSASDGTFVFTGLLQSNATGYTVTVTPGAGLTPGTAIVGTPGGTAGVNNDTVTGIVLGAGASGTGYQFPVVGTTIQGVVFIDTNANGVADTGEVGVPNVTITLTDSGGGTTTITTDAVGGYSFAGFPAGTYTITETVPTGYGTTTPTTRTVNVPAQGVTGQRFGLSASSLSGTVYNDLNNSGTPQVGEPGIGGVTINLRNGANAVVATTVTASNGTYTFINLPGGVYTIEEIQPAAYGQGLNSAGTAGGSTATLDLISAINLPVTTDATGYNFGERGATVTGTVFLDNNANNAVDPGEGGLAGVTIQLLDGNGVVVATTVTAADGTYAFPNLPAGNYTVVESPPVGYGSSGTTSRPITVTTAGAAPQLFGVTTSSLTGRAYLDLNNDGTPQAGEPAIPGVTMTLIGTDAGGNSVIRTTITDANGNYTFAGLVAGTYSIAQAQPANYQIGKASAGTAGGTVGTDLIVGIGLPFATNATGYNFGSLGYNVSGVVFVDANRDGAFEVGEAGLGGVPITLELRNQANQVVATTTSAPDGSYTFTNIVAGTYTVVETPPTGYGTSTPTQLPVNVSNANVVGQNFGVTTASIAGLAFLDVNRNNQYNLGVDVPGAGVTVTLTGTDANGAPVSRTLAAAADGSFLFSGLLSGNYTVTTQTYPGVTQVAAIPGTAGGTVTGLDSITNIGLAPGVQATNYLYPGVGVPVTGTVYNDLNRDGVLNNGEAGISGVTVTLTGVNRNTGQSVTLTAITDANGQYVFPSAVAQGGTLQVVVPAGYAANTPTTINASVPATGLANQNFGLTLGRIAGTVFADRANNGDFDATDAPIANVVLILTGVDANGRAVNTSTVSAADGSFAFEGLNAGTYTITEIQPAGYLDGIIRAGSTGGTAGANTISGITLGLGQVSTANNFAELIPASLAGSVYVDADNDGTRDATEVGVQNVVVTLTGVDDLGNAVNLTTTTRASGNYNFNNLRPSNGAGYTITETPPAGYLDGTPNPGSQGGVVVGRTITGLGLTPGIQGINNNFAELAPATVTGSVFVDANGNGALNPGELGIGGVTVTLTGVDDLGNAVSLTTTTNSNGAYTFTNLRPSNGDGYTVTETRPAGYLPGLGSTTGTVNTGVIPGVIVTPGLATGGVDFSELVPSSLSGFVYADLNNSGAKGAGEPGIAGVIVRLTGLDDTGATVNLVATTDANGFYSFTNLRPSLNDPVKGLPLGYTLTEEQPAGYLDGTDAAGNSGGILGNDVVATITLPQGFAASGYNFGELPPTHLSGFVYNDRNNNGIKDADEAGIAGVAITLTGTDDQGNTVNIATTTDANGAYAFVNIRPSNAAGYTITEAQPAGYVDGRDTIGNQGGVTLNDAFANIRVSGNTVGVNNNFGEILGSRLTGTAFVDGNGNGVRDGNEPGIAGVVVTLTGVDDLGNPVNLTTTTDANGDYSFGVRPSNVAGYTITQTQPPGYLPGRGLPGSLGGAGGVNTVSGIVVATDSVGTGVNFGNVVASSLAGSVYFDVNKDGVRQPGEAGLGGITVTLTGRDIYGNPVNTFATTGADGSYLFANLVPGTYTVSDLPPANFLPGQVSPGTAGGTVAGTSVTGVNLGSGVAATLYDFAEVGATIAGTTFVDSDGNGVRNGNEPAAGGVTVTLVGPNGNVLGSTVTGADGSYQFPNLPLDSYTVVMTPPAGLTAAATSYPVCCCDPVNGVIRQDLPLRPLVAPATASLSGFLYVDADGNGVRSAGDPALPGVVVTLTGTDSTGQPVTRQTQTGADGSYVFTNLPAGTYTIRSGDVAGYADGQVNPGTQGGVVSPDVIASVVLPDGVAAANNNFGKVVASVAGSTISGTVYLDSARNGRLDTNDFGISNIPVHLDGTDANGNPVSRSTTTDRNGRYVFTDLAPGTYRVRVDAPTRFFRPGQATTGIAGGVAGTNQINQIRIGAGAVAGNNNFAEINRPDCRLSDRDVIALLQYGPNSTSVPRALVRRIGGFVRGGAVDTYLPTLADLVNNANPSQVRRNRQNVATQVGRAHPTGVAALNKARKVNPAARAAIKGR